MLNGTDSISVHAAVSAAVAADKMTIAATASAAVTDCGDKNFSAAQSPTAAVSSSSPEWLPTDEWDAFNAVASDLHEVADAPFFRLSQEELSIPAAAADDSATNRMSHSSSCKHENSHTAEAAALPSRFTTDTTSGTSSTHPDSPTVNKEDRHSHTPTDAQYKSGSGNVPNSTISADIPFLMSRPCREESADDNSTSFGFPRGEGGVSGMKPQTTADNSNGFNEVRSAADSNSPISVKTPDDSFSPLFQTPPSSQPPLATSSLEGSVGDAPRPTGSPLLGAPTNHSSPQHHQTLSSSPFLSSDGSSSSYLDTSTYRSAHTATAAAAAAHFRNNTQAGRSAVPRQLPASGCISEDAQRWAEDELRMAAAGTYDSTSGATENASEAHTRGSTCGSNPPEQLSTLVPDLRAYMGLVPTAPPPPPIETMSSPTSNGFMTVAGPFGKSSSTLSSESSSDFRSPSSAPCSGSGPCPTIGASPPPPIQHPWTTTSPTSPTNCKVDSAAACEATPSSSTTCRARSRLGMSTATAVTIATTSNIGAAEQQSSSSSGTPVLMFSAHELDILGNAKWSPTTSFNSSSSSSLNLSSITGKSIPTSVKVSKDLHSSSLSASTAGNDLLRFTNDEEHSSEVTPSRRRARSSQSRSPPSASNTAAASPPSASNTAAASPPSASNTAAASPPSTSETSVRRADHESLLYDGVDTADTAIDHRRNHDSLLERKTSTSSVSSTLSIFDIPRPTQQAKSRGGAESDSRGAHAAQCDDDEMLGGGGDPDDFYIGAVRPAAQVAPEELDDAEKRTIYVVDAVKGKKTPVSWYVDMDLSDVKEAILCACDAMMDAGFRLRELRKPKPQPPVLTDFLVPLDDTSGLSKSKSNETHTQNCVHDDNKDDGTAGRGRTKQQLSSSGSKMSDASDPVVEIDIDGKKRSFRLGRLYEFEEFDQLKHKRTYLLEKGAEREDLKNVTGDKFRRLRIEVNPLLHVEAQKAIIKMRKGANLLKHTQNSFPHLRQFQLCGDLRRLMWYSATKSKSATVVNLNNVEEIRLGQTTTVFKKYQLPTLSHLSFSLIYTRSTFGVIGPRRSVDLTCKDEFEFDTWLTGIKALGKWVNNKDISKHQLLDHSRRFRTALDKNDISVKLSELPEVAPPDTMSLTKCVELPVHSKIEIERKVARVTERHVLLRDKICPIPRHVGGVVSDIESAAAVGGGLNAQSDGSDGRPMLSATSTTATTSSSTVSCNTFTSADVCGTNNGVLMVDIAAKQAHESVFRESTDAEDEQMERERMFELLDLVGDLLSDARRSLQELNSVQPAVAGAPGRSVRSNGAGRSPEETEKLKAVNQTLWKAEVDLENAEDMYRRVTNPRMTSPLAVTLAQFNAQFTEEFHRIGDQISSTVLSWFLPPEADPVNAPPHI